MNKRSTPKGSILIWTVLLSISLTTVFFFFSQRLNMSAMVQRRTIEEQNAKVFLQSYADYVQSLTFNQLVEMAGPIEQDDLTGVLSNAVGQIKGGVDAGQSLTYFVAQGKAKVEWGFCAGDEAGRPFEVTPSDNQKSENCSGGYDQSAEVQNSFTLTAAQVPVSYRIIPLEGAVLYGQTWQLELHQPLAKKTLDLVKNFTPKEG